MKRIVIWENNNRESKEYNKICIDVMKHDSVVYRFKTNKSFIATKLAELLVETEGIHGIINYTGGMYV